MKKRLILLILLVGIALLFFGCETNTKESPQEGLVAMRELHNSGNYATLVRQRYAEKGKLRGEEDYTKLISMMERRYGHADKKESMLKIFDEALKVDPVIEVNPNPQEHETDTMATFTTEQGPVKVYLMKSGLWGFHL